MQRRALPEPGETHGEWSDAMVHIFSRREEALAAGADPKDLMWQGCAYLCTVSDSMEADILVSKLASEGIPALKKFVGSAAYLELVFGRNTAGGIEIYVPEQALEDASNIIVPVDLDDCEDAE